MFLWTSQYRGLGRASVGVSMHNSQVGRQDTCNMHPPGLVLKIFMQYTQTLVSLKDVLYIRNGIYSRHMAYMAYIVGTINLL